MLKKFSKLLLLLSILFVVVSSSFISLAHETEEATASTTTVETNGNNETTNTTPEIHNGDLFLFNNNVVMDKYVNGNVFIIGNNVEITGQVSGNLFVIANNLTFDEAIIRYSIFACANKVYYNGGCGTSTDYSNLYVTANKFEATYNSYVTGDAQISASDIILKSAIGRDANLKCKKLNLGEGTDIPLIYGNLNYTSNREVTIPEGSVNNELVNYTNPLLNNILSIIIRFAICIATALSLYTIFNKLTPNFIQKVSYEKFSIKPLLKALGIGLATIAIVSIFIILLAGSFIGILLSVILTLLFAILCVIATPVLAINIAKILKPVLKIEKNILFDLLLALVSIILYGITIIPYVGWLLGFIIKAISIGLIVIPFIPHKELTDEEKLAIEEAKKQAKENKEKQKQEKLELKASKKEEKLNKKAETAKLKEANKKIKANETTKKVKETNKKEKVKKEK